MALSAEPGAQPIITAADNNTQRRVKHSLLFRLFSAHKLLWSQKTTPCPPTAAPWHFRRMNESRSPQPTLEYALVSPRGGSFLTGRSFAHSPVSPWPSTWSTCVRPPCPPGHCPHSRQSGSPRVSALLGALRPSVLSSPS